MNNDSWVKGEVRELVLSCKENISEANVCVHKMMNYLCVGVKVLACLFFGSLLYRHFEGPTAACTCS